MVHATVPAEWLKIHSYLLVFEGEGLVTRTFRRLDPERQEKIILAILAEAAEKGPTLLNIKQGGRGVVVHLFPKPGRDAGLCHRTCNTVHNR